MSAKTKKQTSGGTYDPTEQFAYFAATNPDRYDSSTRDGVDIMPYEHILVAVNDLDGSKAVEALRRLIDQGRKVLIDSGIFNLAMTHARAHDVSMDVALTLSPEEIDGFEQLKETYYSVVAEFKDDIWGIIEMDQGGAINKPRIRAMIEKETGIVPIPVFHPLLDGLPYYEDLVTGYDRICVGSLVQASPTARSRLLHTIYELSRSHPDVWHHLLGVTPSPLSFSLPIYGSCDSSSWLSHARYPQGWDARTCGRSVGHYGIDLWYSSVKFHDGNEDHQERLSNYYRPDGISLLNAYALEESVNRDRYIKANL